MNHSEKDKQTADAFMELQVQRATNNLKCAINKAGTNALRAANPVPWFKRYPVKCSIATGAILAGGAVAIVMALKPKRPAEDSVKAPAVNVYVKKPKAQSKGLFTQLAAALAGGLTAKLTESLKSTITSSFANESQGAFQPQTIIIPNPKLRDVDI